MTAIASKDKLGAAKYQRERLHRRNLNEKIHNSSDFVDSPGYIIALSLGLMAMIALFAAALHTSVPTAEAFVAKPVVTHRHSSNSRIFLEDWVANMIDGELYRQDHHKEYEAAWMEKNKGAVLSRLSDETSTTAGLYPSQMMDANDREAFVEHKRDERMAFLKPEKYCADRCVATGNCDILEDFYELGPQDVLKFCEECVLSDDVEDDDSGCDIPAAFYEKEPPLRA